MKLWQRGNHGEEKNGESVACTEGKLVQLPQILDTAGSIPNGSGDSPEFFRPLAGFHEVGDLGGKVVINSVGDDFYDPHWDLVMAADLGHGKAFKVGGQSTVVAGQFATLLGCADKFRD